MAADKKKEGMMPLNKILLMGRVPLLLSLFAAAAPAQPALVLAGTR